MYLLAWGIGKRSAGRVLLCYSRPFATLLSWADFLSVETLSWRLGQEATSRITYWLRQGMSQQIPGFALVAGLRAKLSAPQEMTHYRKQSCQPPLLKGFLHFNTLLLEKPLLNLAVLCWAALEGHAVCNKTRPFRIHSSGCPGPLGGLFNWQCFFPPHLALGWRLLH